MTCTGDEEMKTSQISAHGWLLEKCVYTRTQVHVQTHTTV